MKCPLNVNVRMKELLSIAFVALLLMSMAVVVSATPWDGDVDNSTPAQAIWVDPKNTTGLNIGDIFTVDILVNITSPTAPGGGTGMYGFQYKLFWDSRVLEAVEIQTHGDAQPSTDLLLGWTSVYVAANDTGVWPDPPKAGLDYHSYAVSATGGVAFTGVTSLCTYKFQVVANATCRLDIWEDPSTGTILVDDTATAISHTSVDGYYITPYPVAMFTYSPEYPSANQTVTFNATDSYDLDGTIVSYAWDFGDGTKEIHVGANLTDTASHNYTAFGAYNVTLTVTDNDGLTDTAWRTVKVGTVAIFTYSFQRLFSGQDFPLVNQTVRFDAKESHGATEPIVDYTWNFGDGNITSVGVASIKHVYTAFGAYNVTLTVTDSSIPPLTDSTSDLITVIAKPLANFTWSPETPKVGETVTFNGSLSTPEGGSIEFYTWDFGDGSTTTTSEKTITHTYTVAGTYNVNLTVTDDEGLTGSTKKSITVAKASSTITISVSPATLEVDENTTISGSITPNPGAGKTVTIHKRPTGGTWSTLADVTTDSDGEYSYVWTPDEAGTYEVKASWPGDANYLGDESDPETVTVEKAPAPAPPYMLYAVIVIVIIIVAAVVVYFLKRKS